MDIKISAIGLVLDISDVKKIGELDVSDDFAAYMPSQNIPRPTYYDFIGVVIDFETASITSDNFGYIIKLKLINQEDNPDFFTVDMFINQDNMRFDNLEKGMKVTGLLWFQGELV